MADRSTDPDNLDAGDTRLEVSDADAERLLADPADDGDRPERRPRTRRDDGEDRPRRRTRNRDDVADDTADDSDDEDAGGLGERGRRALDAMKEQRKAAVTAERAAKRQLAELQERLAKFEDKDKSELQRLQEAAQSGLSRAEKAEAALRRREIAEERAPAHATLAQIKAVAKRLAGGTDDELYDDADELFEFLAPEPPKPTRTTRRPEERLQRPRGGVDPEEDDEESDPRKLAALIRSRGR